jgi:hypothetical protein
VRKQRVNAGFRFHGRLRVQLVIHFVAFLRDRQKVGIGHNIEWIARFLRAHPAAHGSIVVTVCHGEQHDECVEDPNRLCAHEMDSPSIVAQFPRGALLVAQASRCGVWSLQGLTSTGCPSKVLRVKSLCHWLVR